MRAEIIYIGTELLLGQILNSNAVFLGGELASLGIDCYFQTVVGDNKDRIKESFQTALSRADLVITTGGLGPTSDDLTTECWAGLFNESLILDEKVLKHIEELFKKRNRQMPITNQKQAQRPKTADLLPNPVGTAPGIIWDVTEHCKNFGFGNGEQKLVLTFPGVPRELHAMWEETARPYLAKLGGGSGQLVWKELKFYGIGESALAELCQDLLDLNDPTVAPLAGRAECRLRLATKAQTQEFGQAKLLPIEEEIKKRAGNFLYGFNSDTLESLVAQKLKTQNLTIALAESCTGGLLSKRLTDLPGSSSYVKCNFVTYSNESKTKLLGVSKQVLEEQGAVSEEVAKQMAEGARKVSETDYGLGVTGIAGPDGGTPEKPVGTVYMAIASENKTEVKKFNFGSAARDDIRWLSSQEALFWLTKLL